jgi:predicted AlkP superfamily phosphohydrolase/phosphomutase
MRVKKVFVFAIDGASWNILDVLIKKGLMPNLAALVKASGQGVMKGSLPPTTFPAWINFATGTDPGSHGIYGMLHQKEFGQVGPFLKKDCRVETFYQILDRTGYKSVLVNLPGAFPLKLKNGFGLASFLFPGSEGFYPASLIKEIPEAANFKTYPDYLGGAVGFKDLVRQFLEIERQRFLIAKKMFAKDWDFFFYLVSAYDWLFHRFSDLSLEEILKKAGVSQFFKEIDSQLAWFLKNCFKARFFLISDHGFNRYPGRIFLNRWLIDQGFLTLEEKGYRRKEELPRRIHLIRDERYHRFPFGVIFSCLDKLPVVYSLIGKLIRKLSFLSQESLGLKLAGESGLGINREKSRAIVFGGYHCFLNLSSQKKKLLVQKMKALRLPGAKSPVFSDLVLPEKVFPGSDLNYWPQMILIKWGKLVVDPLLWSRSLFEKKPIFNHQEKGIFLAFGPGIGPTNGLEAAMEDLAPTILSLFGLKPAKTMTGKIIKFQGGDK